MRKTRQLLLRTFKSLNYLWNECLKGNVWAMCGRNSRMFSSFSFRCCLVVKRAHLIFCISHIRWKLLQFPRFYPPNEIKSIIISRGVHLQFFVFARRWNLQPADIWYSVYNWIEFKCYVHQVPVHMPPLGSSYTAIDDTGVGEIYKSVTWD